MNSAFRAKQNQTKEVPFSIKHFKLGFSVQHLGS